MPLKFWKKEKPEKGGKEEPEGKGKEAPPKEEPKKAAAPEAQKTAAPPEAPKKAAAPEPAKVAVPPTPVAAGAADAKLRDIHAKLVDLGLTIPATKEIFAKRAAAYPGGAAAFLKDFEAEPYRATTRVLAGWLGLRVAADFDPPALLAEANPRLSSFGLNAEVHDLTWLDQELGLRKARLVLGGQEKVVRFKDPRDFVKGLNDLIAPKKVAFLELETWSPDFAFILVREPKWDRLAATDLVVVKAPQTAAGGECGECGAKVGQFWNDCLSCGAVFG